MMFLFTNVAGAATLASLMKTINKVIINPVIILVFALALIFFLYGVFEYVLNQTKDDKRSQGRQHMLWGLIGMFIMVSVFLIMGIIMNTFGIEGINPKAGTVDLPSSKTFDVLDINTGTQ
ncbi:MAG: hypothetical protein WDK96_03120 [Candidatus Paceibacterota bacterium]|jgi:hypothetical protein